MQLKPIECCSLMASDYQLRQILHVAGPLVGSSFQIPSFALDDHLHQNKTLNQASFHDRMGRECWSGC